MTQPVPAIPWPSGEIPAPGSGSEPPQTPNPAAAEAPIPPNAVAPPTVISSVPPPEVKVPASSSSSGNGDLDPRLLALTVVGATAFAAQATRSPSRNGGVKFVSGPVGPVQQAPSSPDGPTQPSVANTIILFPSTRAEVVPKRPPSSPVLSDGEVRFVPDKPGSETGAIIIGREEVGPPGSISTSTGYDVWVDDRYQHVDAIQSGPGLYPARIEGVRSGSTVRIEQTVVTTWTDRRGTNRVETDFDTTVSPYAPRLNQGKQDKHIPGTNNYIPGKSIWTDPDPQGLLDRYCGTGQQATPKFDIPTPGSKERVDFGKVVGQYYDSNTGQYVPTTKGMIIYSSTGEHIIPAAP
ncbi:polymorphic toxin type 50 domain-containing protein [Nocardia vulneris]|uniref:polymorphic toxin type 50 domain-containing protein n=1 Tax=Nocardia vulneris TaxID=1141657 RepID=UPI0035A25E84